MESKLFQIDQFNFDGWWIYDPNSDKEFFLAPHLKEILGLKDSAIPYELHWFIERIHPDDKEQFEKTITSSNLKNETIEYRILTNAQEYIWVLCRINREKKRISGIQTDITEQKETELQLARSNKELEQFAYVTSHDLQSPIRHIWTFSDLSKKYIKDGNIEKAEESIEKVIQTCAHIKNLVQDLLNYSRLGRDELIFEKVQISEVLNSAQEIISSQFGEDSIIYEIIGDKYSEIKVNKEYMIDSFVNLMSNSIKYSSKKRSPKLIIKISKKKAFTEFEFKDNGIGISKNELESIFNIFKRTSNSKNIKGQGIGLSSVKRVIELHGGRMYVSSEVDIGTNFNFTIKN